MTCQLCRRIGDAKHLVVPVELPSGRKAVICAECNRDDPMRDQRLRRLEERL
jgi:hypothetical protein